MGCCCVGSWRGYGLGERLASRRRGNWGLESASRRGDAGTGAGGSDGDCPRSGAVAGRSFDDSVAHGHREISPARPPDLI